LVTPNGTSLDALGREIDSGAAPTPNADGLRRLGAQIDGGAKHARRHRRRRRRGLRITMISMGVVVVLLVGLAAGAYYYAYTKYERVVRPLCGTTHKVCDPEIRGKPFNVLVVGSDSRAGLSGKVAAETGAGSVSGQRSDVVRIFHVNPEAGTISVVSIPRDTVVSLLQNQSLYGQFNRINVNYQNGPELLVRTIEANFGIPINHVVQVSFGGLIGAVNALGGVYMDFPYPALDIYSSLDIHHTGCQLLSGIQALSVARSRHYQYYEDGQWL
jgi:LCP family protein required for cell wall assembly